MKTDNPVKSKQTLVQLTGAIMWTNDPDHYFLDIGHHQILRICLPITGNIEDSFGGDEGYLIGCISMPSVFLSMPLRV